MSSIVILGSINQDITSYLDQRPRIGETIVANDITLNLGGKGANQAIAVSRLDVPTHMIGAIGKDVFGTDAKNTLQTSGVKCHLEISPNLTTGLAVIDVSKDGANNIRICSGANAHMTAKCVRFHASIIAKAKILLLQNEIPLDASLEAARIAAVSGTTVIMDPAPAPGTPWTKQILSLFDYLTPNQQEVGTLIGWVPQCLREAEIAAQEICGKGARNVIVTAGEIGIAWNIAGKSGRLTAAKVNAIDTVAAGDCFNAAFAVCLMRGLDIKASLKFACSAAAIATTRSGASASAPSFDEVIQFMDTSLEELEEV